MAEPAAALIEVERADRVAVLRINNPKVNALSTAVLLALEQTLAGLSADMPDALVLRGDERFFAAGADVDELADPSRAEELLDAFHRALGALAEFPRVTIAAISGYALGGGLELALACDVRLAGSNATLGSPEINLGIIPGAGGTQRLSRVVGIAHAKDLIFSGRSIDASEAFRIGLVSKVVDLPRLFETAAADAAAFADGPVVALALAKAAIDGGYDLPIEAGLGLERSCFMEVLGTEDARMGLENFAAKRPRTTRFVGR